MAFSFSTSNIHFRADRFRRKYYHTDLHFAGRRVDGLKCHIYFLLPTFLFSAEPVKVKAKKTH